MNAKMKFTSMLTAGLVATGALAGCGDDSGEPTAEPVDHATASQSVQDNTQRASDRLQHALTFVRQTDMLGDFVANLDGAEVCSGDGFVGGGDDGLEGEGSVECEPGEPIEDGIDSGAAELVDLLNTRVFVDANIEQESQTEVTYLLDGQTVCADNDFDENDFDEADERDECISDVDALELRLVVTSQRAGDVDIDVLVGPDRHNPVDFELHQDVLAAAVDLAAVRDTILFGSSATGEEAPELPATMQGIVRGELRFESQHETTATVAIFQDVRIVGDDYDVTIAQASPAAQLRLDESTETITGLLDLAAVDLQGPVTETETTWDMETGEESTTETSYLLDAHLGGASVEATYTVGDQRIDFQNVGLGDTTSTIDVDQNRVFELDLNQDDGRLLDFSFVNSADGTQLQVDPAFDLEVLFAFAQVQDKFDDLDDWMLDDLMRITFDGATTPTLLFGEQGAEVVEGNLALSSTAADVTLEAAAGQCLIAPADDAPEVGTGGEGDLPPLEDSAHPFEELSVEACE